MAIEQERVDLEETEHRLKLYEFRTELGVVQISCEGSVRARGGLLRHSRHYLLAS